MYALQDLVINFSLCWLLVVAWQLMCVVGCHNVLKGSMTAIPLQKTHIKRFVWFFFQAALPAHWTWCVAKPRSWMEVTFTSCCGLILVIPSLNSGYFPGKPHLNWQQQQSGLSLAQTMHTKLHNYLDSFCLISFSNSRSLVSRNNGKVRRKKRRGMNQEKQCWIIWCHDMEEYLYQKRLAVHRIKGCG